MTAAPGRADFERAMAILGEPSANVAQAADLLQRSAAAGSAAAAGRLAVIAAMGVASPPDWNRALDWLARAAELGDSGARHQLSVLAEPAEEPSLDDRDWQSVRRAIDIAERTATPPAQPVSDLPRLRAFRNFASAAECRLLIETARPHLSAATVFAGKAGQAHHDQRDNQSVCFQLGEMPFLAEVVRARIASATRLPVPFFEPPQVLRYQPGQRFALHVDFFDPANASYRDELARRGQRVGTFLLYLNEEYEAGETDFPAAGIKWRGKTGDGLFFANIQPDGSPDRRSTHAGLPPSTGEKWVFSQWIRDRVAQS